MKIGWAKKSLFRCQAIIIIIFILHSMQVVYVAVEGKEGINKFTVVVWDLLFTQDRDQIAIFEGKTGVVYDVSRNLNSKTSGTS